MRRLRKRKSTAIILISACLILTGCTTVRTFPLPRAAAEAQASGIRKGDHVMVRLRSGETRDFRVKAIEADALVSRSGRVAFADIEKLQREQVAIGRTAALVAGVVATVALGLFVHMVAENARNSD